MDIRLRPWHLDDLPELVKLANNLNVSKYMTNTFPYPYAEENGRKFIAFATSEPLTRIFSIEYNGNLAGGIGVHPQTDIMEKNAELGYWLGEDYWGKGIMTRVIPQVIEFAFKNLPITRLYARPFSNNPGSQRVLAKTGFKLEARIAQNIYKNGEFLDELIYAVRNP